MITLKFMASEGNGQGGRPEQSADDYLSKLANSVLSKDKPKRSPLPPTPQRPITHFDEEPSAPQPSHRTSSGENRSPSSGEISVKRLNSQPGEWIRQVNVRDEDGNLLPGAILLFEDGNIGIYKEHNPAKDYDIVYTLKPSGAVAAMGMALYNYDVEPLGKLSHAVFEALVRDNRWERDMLVFHLLRYTDRKHIPHVVEGDPQPVRQESFSRAEMRKLGTMDLIEEDEQPKLTRGRQMTIKFGSEQKWSAVYWGKDEMGDVVAHNTHDKWALMHLDLARFKDSIVFHEMVSDETMRGMERDFAAR